jgi:hypothetical protein
VREILAYEAQEAISKHTSMWIFLI